MKFLHELKKSSDTNKNTLFAEVSPDRTFDNLLEVG